MDLGTHFGSRTQVEKLPVGAQEVKRFIEIGLLLSGLVNYRPTLNNQGNLVTVLNLGSCQNRTEDPECVMLCVWELDTYLSGVVSV